MQRTTIMLPRQLKQRLQKRATAAHKSVGEILRLAAEEYLDRQSVSWDNDPLSGSGFVIRDRGPRDVSANVDKYLYGGK